MQKPTNIKELIKRNGIICDLKSRAAARARVLDHVRTALPARLAQSVLTAGVEDGRLTLGVAAAVWATRLRFHAAELREAVSGQLGAPVHAVRIRIIPLST